MKKTVLIFGLISGAVSSAMMFATLPFLKNGAVNFENGEIIGYTAIVLSFVLVFFGIRSYRENKLGGEISFGKAFAAGLLITLVSCLFYIISWEIIYFNFMPDFGTHYANSMIEKARAEGATPEMIEMQMKQMADFKALYDNPFINAAITFLEPFPVGLVITLISAGILRKKKTAVA